MASLLLPSIPSPLVIFTIAHLPVAISWLQDGMLTWVALRAVSVVAAMVVVVANKSVEVATGFVFFHY